MDYPKLRAYLIQEIGEEHYREMLDRKPVNPKDKVPPIHFYEFFGGLSGSNRVDATPRQVDAYRILAFVGAYMMDPEDSGSKKMIKQLATQYADDWLSESEAVGFLRAAGATLPKANGKEKFIAKAKTNAYRWNSILTIKELVELLAEGDPRIEKQVHDTLRHMASNNYYTMNTNHRACRVMLSKGLLFLESKGHALPEWTASIMRGEGLQTSTPLPVNEVNQNDELKPSPLETHTTPNAPPPMDEVEASKEKKPTRLKPHIAYWSEVQKKNHQAPACGISKVIEKVLMGPDSDEKKEAEKHFELFQGHLSLKGTHKSYAQATIDGWHSAANKLWRSKHLV